MPARKVGAPTSGMVVEVIPIDRVIPYARNPRRNTAAVAKVAASLREFGWRQPIVVDEAMTVIAGHTRLAAARQLGMETVPVHVAAGLSPVQVKAYRLADNRVGEESEWDPALLALEINDLELDDFDLSVLGFEERELRDVMGRDDDGGAPDDTGPALGGVQFQVVVTCTDERSQAALCERLESEGYECRLLTL